MNTFRIACIQACCVFFIAATLSAQSHPYGAHFSKFHPDSLSLFPGLPFSHNQKGTTSRTSPYLQLDSFNTPLSSNPASNSEAYKYEFQYNQNQQNTAEILYTGSENKWYANFRRTWKYNEDGNLQMKGLEQHLTSGWFLLDYFEYAYNNNNDLSEITKYYWNFDSLNWSPTTKTIYNYGVNSWLSQEKKYQWDVTGQTVSQISKTQYQYNSQGNIVQTTNYSCVADDVCYLASRTDFVYDSNQNIIRYSNHKYNGLVWTAQNKNEFEYNSSNQITSRTGYQWSNNIWTPTASIVNTYDNYDNLTESKFADWSTTLNDWSLRYKDVYFYDNQFANEDLVIPFYFDDKPKKFGHKLVKAEYYQYGLSGWQLVNPEYFHWTPVTTSDASTPSKALALQLSPNPATDKLNLTTEQPLDDATLTLTNLAGQIVLQQGLHDQKAIEVGHLHSGLYFYQVSSPKTGIASGKVVIEQ